MSKDTMAPFGAELSGDLEQQVSVITTVITWICLMLMLVAVKFSHEKSMCFLKP